MAVDCGTMMAKYCLKLFNFLFFIAGAILLGVGFWLAIDKNSFVRLLTKISQDTALHQFSQPTVIEQASWILIAAGGFVFILSCLGYCGAYQESTFMLGTYSILVIAILALEITAAGLAINYKAEADTNTRDFLKSTITKYYATADKADAVTLMWNYLMGQFKCCGVDSYRDFSLSEKWAQSNKVVPNACCVLEGEMQYFKPKDPSCPDRPSESNSYYNKGCYQALYSWIKQNLDLVIAVCLSLAAIQVLGIIFACCLCHKLGG